MNPFTAVDPKNVLLSAQKMPQANFFAHNQKNVKYFKQIFEYFLKRVKYFYRDDFVLWSFGSIAATSVVLVWA